MTPEDGQTTTITVIAEDNTILSDGRARPVHLTLPIAAFAGRSRGWVKFTSKTSAGVLQGHSIYAIVGEGCGYIYGLQLRMRRTS